MTSTDEYPESRLLGWLLHGFVLFIPLAISPAQALLFTSIVVGIYAWLRRGYKDVFRAPYFWPMMLFFSFVLISSWGGIRPHVSFEKCHRLIIFMGLFAMGYHFSSSSLSAWKNGLCMVLFFVTGATLLGVYDILRVPMALSRGVELFHTGNMRDPQMYLVSLCFILAAWTHGAQKSRGLLFLGLAAINLAGLILHFKRGSWLAFLVAVLFMSALSKRKRVFVAVCVCALGALLLPQVQTRIDALNMEFSQAQGGRYVLWTQVAPSMLKDYPLGMGWRAPRHDDLLAYSQHIQPGLDHLHNNVLQLALEVGWVGVGMWIVWMVTVFVVMLNNYRRASEGAAEKWIALGVWTGFLGLMVNGVVEYNFGDSEILMALTFLMGLSLMQWRGRVCCVC